MKKVDLLDIDSSMLSNLVVVAAKDQISRDLDGEAVILNMKSGVYCGLNEVGWIWGLISESRRIGEVLEILLEKYEVEPRRFAGKMDERGSRDQRSGIRGQVLRGWRLEAKSNFRIQV